VTGHPVIDHAALIDGKDVVVTTSFTDIDPSTGQSLGEVAACGAREIDDAVRSARRAYESVWSRLPVAERAATVRRMAVLITRDEDELTVLESRDSGKPLSQARADVRVAARYFEFYGGVVEGATGRHITTGPDMSSHTVDEPHGVCGHIVPWNYPIQVSARTLAPALAAGNCCVLKPAEQAPLTALQLGRLAAEAGIPDGVLNVVTGLGDEAGAALAAHPYIDYLSFTGSVAVGRLVGRAAADNIVPVGLEMGGKSPNIVFADADLDRAVPFIANSILQNAGQTCSAGSRLLVQEGVHAELLDRLRTFFAGVSIGAGPDDPDLGPLISAKQLERVRGFAAIGRDVSMLVCGGDVPEATRDLGGYYFEPTIFDGVPADSRLAQEEVFGPVLSVLGFRGVREAAQLANSTPYGLIAAVWTQDVDRAHWLAKEIRAGQVYVNTYGAGGGVELPFGGYGLSGFGREKGVEGLSAYTRSKTVAFHVAAPPP
jgi:aldehyde dehydrogenase (NAD+)